LAHSARALISLAAPRFRDELTAAALNHGLFCRIRGPEAVLWVHRQHPRGRWQRRTTSRCFPLLSRGSSAAAPARADTDMEMIQIMIRVLVVDDSLTNRVYVSALLKGAPDIEVCGTAVNGREAVEKSRELNPNVVVMDINMPEMNGIEATRELSEQLPSVAVVIMSTESEIDYLRRALQAGAREYLTKPFEAEELFEAVRRVDRLGRLRQEAFELTASTAGRMPEPVEGEVTVIFGGKGGSGRTLLAGNLAAALAAATRAPVALVDLDLRFGDVSLLFNLDAHRGIADIATADVMDWEFVSSVMVDGPLGVRVLTAPISPEFAELVTPAAFTAMLAMLREHFLHTVIDTSTQLGETTLVALDAATKIVVVVNPTMLSIKNAKLTLHILSVLNVASDRTCLVVVHNAERQSIQLEDIERTLQCPAAVVIPFDGDTVEGALREGKSFLDTKPEARISRSVRVLVGQVVGAAVEAGEPHPRQRASPVLRAASHS